MLEHVGILLVMPKGHYGHQMVLKKSLPVWGRYFTVYFTQYA